jgi:Asp-tRNA(Asn)/Glu-tRNA(Gln) amidotransferase A subunit family amidase
VAAERQPLDTYPPHAFPSCLVAGIEPALLVIDAPIVDGQAIPYELKSVYPAIATLSGQPTTAFSIGVTRSGLPIGLQATGPYLEDYTSIHWAVLVAQESGGFRPTPRYAEETEGRL